MESDDLKIIRVSPMPASMAPSEIFLGTGYFRREGEKDCIMILRDITFKNLRDKILNWREKYQQTEREEKWCAHRELDPDLRVGNPKC